MHTVLADAVADCTFVPGCTARARRVAFEELRPAAAASQILANINAAGEVALLFGRERTGLTNEELQLCHVAVHIPADPLFSSLNLAAAVQILAYEIRLASLDAPSAPLHSTSGFRKTPASHAQLEGLFGQFKQTLDEIDFSQRACPGIGNAQIAPPVCQGRADPARNKITSGSTLRCPTYRHAEASARHLNHRIASRRFSCAERDAHGSPQKPLQTA